MVIDDDKLAEILEPKTGGRAGVRKHEHLIAPVHDLYDLGLTHKQLLKIFPVSLKWLRARFKERERDEPKFQMRPPGARPEDQRRIDPKKVKNILKNYEITDEDLRSDVRKRSGRRRKRRIE